MKSGSLLLLAFLSSLAFGAKASPKPKSQPLTSDQRSALSLVKRMTLSDQVAQMVMISAHGQVYGARSPEYRKYRHLVRDVRVGGLTINNVAEYGLVRHADPHALAVFLNQMQRLAKIPLLVSSDFERGASMRVNGAALFPYSMAYGAANDTDGARFEGLTAAREARALGVHWIFAPVSDVNINPQNPVINLRSYGEDPEQVAQLVAAFIDGAHSDPNNPVLVTAKHFPGHGDTSANSHVDLPELAASRERLESVEFVPFRAAIAHGIDSIMTAHLTAPALEPEGIPATVSANVTRALRDELHFSDLIVTDAMDMKGLAAQFPPAEAAVRAVEAGADVLLMPPDPERAIRAVVSAVEHGRIPKSRIEQSAERILAAKIRVGLMKKKLVDLDAIADALNSPEAENRAQETSDRAITLVKDAGGLLPLARDSRPCVVVMREARASTAGLRMAQEIQARARGARVAVVDASLPLQALNAAVGDTSTCSAIVLVTSVTASDTRTDMAIAGDLGAFATELTEGPVPVALVSLGSPYLLGAFPKAAASLAAFSPTVPSEISAAKALFGEIPITGHLPVTIPGLAARGDGIEQVARSR
ncbi:MAG TPA: glycoside hydrolase family 3 N-terminal domain-containing protein [Bryobacteraceae bacterium]|nr:glycoside hydrolase family 3 N-terminal domain-containing protein [Bryobacteraceae bacterium]